MRGRTLACPLFLKTEERGYMALYGTCNNNALEITSKDFISYVTFNATFFLGSHENVRGVTLLNNSKETSGQVGKSMCADAFRYGVRISRRMSETHRRQAASVSGDVRTVVRRHNGEVGRRVSTISAGRHIAFAGVRFNLYKPIFWANFLSPSKELSKALEKAKMQHFEFSLKLFER